MRELAKTRRGTRNDLVIQDDHFYPLAGRSESEKTNVVNSQNRGTLGEIAKMAGVGHTTAEQYDAIQRKGTFEQKQAVSLGTASITKIYNNIQRQERLEQNKLTEWPKGKYRVIYADPPWQYGDEIGSSL